MNNLMFLNYPHFSPLMIALFVWTIVWTGLALWKAAREGDELWFIILLLVHTLGILDIIYFYLVHHKKNKKQVASTE